VWLGAGAAVNGALRGSRPNHGDGLWAACDLRALDWSGERCLLTLWVNTNVGFRYSQPVNAGPQMTRLAV
jgi:hypothetical protein